jgi:hypothetical protein
MLIDFNEMVERSCPGMNKGTGMMSAKMYISKLGRFRLLSSTPGDVNKHEHIPRENLLP